MSRDSSRYERQLLLPGFGTTGQARLEASTAVVLGCGALGAFAADGLARAGIGHLIIIDRDFVELGNLHRQVLFDEQDAAATMPKAEAARRKLERINSEVKISAIVDDLNHRNIEQYLKEADVLVDGLDNFETRYLANDFAVARGIPYIHGAAVGTSGASLTILPHAGDAATPWSRAVDSDRSTACLRCLYPEVPAPGSMPSCETAGVLGAAVGVIAQLEVAQALKVLTGNFAQIDRRLFSMDLWSNSFHQIRVSRNEACRCCGQRQFDCLDGRQGSSAATLCGRNAVQLTHWQHAEMPALEQIAARLRRLGAVKVNAFILQARIIDQGHRFELTLFPDGRAIVHGTGDPQIARSLYAKYIGS